MHKHLLGWVVVLVAIFAAAIFAVSTVKATDSLPWISSALSIQKQAETQSLPSSLNGNIDCAMEDALNCSVPTAYGAASQNSKVRLNGSGDFMPVISYIDNRQHFLPVSNSNTFITYTTEPPYGFYLYFNYNFLSSITKTFVPGTTQAAYKINRQPDGKLVDKANRRLAADYTSMSFSQNGQWMVVSQPNVAMLRVNLQTFEALPFAAGFNYTIGLSPAPKTAITNDGRYAVVASKDFSRFTLYDLSTCGAVPNTINGPVACQSRDLNNFMQQQVSGYILTSYARFMDDNTLAIYATYRSDNINKTARFIISNSTITNQIDYLALGDSYISGEGAFDYQGGTDTDNNKCHLSLLAYPYLVGHDLNYNSYHSVACSGAITDDITDTLIPNGRKKPQFSGKEDTSFDGNIYENYLPGHRAQINFVSRYQPQIITVSIGGNDMGFSKIIMSCVPFWQPNTCYSSYEDRLELVRQINNQVFPKLVQTYQKIRAAGPPDMRIYAIGYPQIALPSGDCALNVRLNNDELIFAQQLIAYLNQVTRQAAAKTGIYYADVEDAFNGHRLCEAKPDSVAMNGLTGGNDRPDWLAGPIGVESYHPNAFGYQLLENTVLAATYNLTEPMPVPKSAAAPPAEAGLAILDAPRSGRPVKIIQYDPSLTDDTVYRGTPAEVTLNGSAHSLSSSTTLQAELHSDTISLGSYKTDVRGDLTAPITLPADVPTGYHSLHFYGTDVAGQSIDIYKIIYVADSSEDLGGGGNITEAPVLPTPSPTVNSSGQNEPAVQLSIMLNNASQDLQPSVSLPNPVQASLILDTNVFEPTKTQTITTQPQSTATITIITTSSSSPVVIQNPQVTNDQDILTPYYPAPAAIATSSYAIEAGTFKLLAVQTYGKSSGSPSKVIGVLLVALSAGSVAAIVASRK